MLVGVYVNNTRRHGRRLTKGQRATGPGVHSHIRLKQELSRCQIRLYWDDIVIGKLNKKLAVWQCRAHDNGSHSLYTCNWRVVDSAQQILQMFWCFARLLNSKPVDQVTVQHKTQIQIQPHLPQLHQRISSWFLYSTSNIPYKYTHQFWIRNCHRNWRQWLRFISPHNLDNQPDPWNDSWWN